MVMVLSPLKSTIYGEVQEVVPVQLPVPPEVALQVTFVTPTLSLATPATTRTMAVVVSEVVVGR